MHIKGQGEDQRGAVKRILFSFLKGESVHSCVCNKYCCWNGAEPEVPETILPRGHMHRPPLFRHAWDDGSVVYFQSRAVPMALNANAGTEDVLGSSGPAQWRAIHSEIDYSQQIASTLVQFYKCK